MFLPNPILLKMDGLSTSVLVQESLPMESSFTESPFACTNTFLGEHLAANCIPR